MQHYKTTFPAYDIPAKLRANFSYQLIHKKPYVSIHTLMAHAALELACWWCNEDLTTALQPHIQADAMDVVKLWMEGLGYKEYPTEALQLTTK